MNIEQLDKKQLIKYGLIGIAALLIGLLVFNLIYNRPAEPNDINDEHLERAITAGFWDRFEDLGQRRI